MPASERPLSGRAVVVTRPRHQAEGMARSLEKLGAEVVLIPAIRIEPKSDMTSLHGALRDLHSYDWVVFTSVNGVRITWDQLEEAGVGRSDFDGIRVAAIGPATARALRSRGVAPDFVPDEFVAEEVAAGIPGVKGARILLPRAAGARPVLPEQLEERGGQVDEIRIYEAVRGYAASSEVDRLRSGVDALTFTSPSIARNFTQMMDDAGLNARALPGRPTVACIGPITARAARELGYEPDVTASEYTAEGLVEALTRHWTPGDENGHR